MIKYKIFKREFNSNWNADGAAVENHTGCKLRMNKSCIFAFVGHLSSSSRPGTKQTTSYRKKKENGKKKRKNQNIHLPNWKCRRHKLSGCEEKLNNLLLSVGYIHLKTTVCGYKSGRGMVDCWRCSFQRMYVRGSQQEQPQVISSKDLIQMMVSSTY